MDLAPLRESGLTDGEIKVYLSLLELGSSTTGPLIDASGVARSIIYLLLEKLVQKGLVSSVLREKRRYYQAAEPMKLLAYIDERREHLEENRKQVENLIPQLLLRQSASAKSEVSVYVGMKGLMTAHEHTYLKLGRGEEYCFLGVPAFQPATHHLYWQRDHERRIKDGIGTRLLFNRDTKRAILANRNSYALCDARYMPPGVKTPTYYEVYKDTVVLTIPSDEPVSIEIVNQQVADSFQAYFEEFWKQSRPFR